MAQALKIFLGVAVFFVTAKCGVLNNDDRVKRTACPYCNENQPSQPASSGGRPPQLPLFMSRQWAGVARSNDGSQHEAFSGAAVNNQDQSAGEVFSLAASSNGQTSDNHQTLYKSDSDQNPEPTRRIKYNRSENDPALEIKRQDSSKLNSLNREDQQQQFQTDFENDGDREISKLNKKNNGNQNDDLKYDSSNLQQSTSNDYIRGDSSNDEQQVQRNQHNSQSPSNNQNQQNRYNDNNNQQFNGNYRRNQQYRPYPNSRQDDNSYSHNHNEQNRYNDYQDSNSRYYDDQRRENPQQSVYNRYKDTFNYQSKDNSNFNNTDFINNSNGVETPQNQPYDRYRDMQYQQNTYGRYQNSDGQRGFGNNKFNSSSTGPQSDNNANAQEIVPSAWNLANQGLQAAQQAGNGCTTCGKSSYALSNAKSYSGSAVAISVGG